MSHGVSRGKAIRLLGVAATLVPTATRAQGTAVRIGSTAGDPFFEPFIALDRGFFQRAGIDATVTVFPNTGATVQAVAAGALDTGLADTSQIAVAVRHGFPFAIYAAGGLYSTKALTEVLCVAKTSPFKTGKDLEGQRVGLVVLGSMTQAAVQDWLQSNGADPSKVAFYELPYAEMLSALERGTVAAAFLIEPFLTAARDQVRIIGKCYDSVAPSFYVSAWFAPRPWIELNANLIQRLIQVVYATAQWANGHQTETASILAKYGKLNLDAILAMTRHTYATSMANAQLQPVLDIAFRHHLIDEPVTARALLAVP